MEQFSVSCSFYYRDVTVVLGAGPEVLHHRTCALAAGIYSILEPEMSRALRERKTEAFQEANADVIVTTNPGCLMQFEAAKREGSLSAKIMHLAEVIDEAERI